MIKRKDRILISAIELLGEEGVNGITTKNLALKESVSEAALYRQYKGKQEILNQILEEYAGYDEQIENTIMQTSLKGKKAIIFYVTRYAENFQNYFEMTTIMFSMDLYYYNNETKSFMENIIHHRIDFLESIIESNLEEFSLSNVLNSKEIASLVNGIIFSQVYEWRMSNKSYDLVQKLVSVISKIL